jgi:hypothetical protein
MLIPCIDSLNLAEHLCHAQSMTHECAFTLQLCLFLGNFDNKQKFWGDYEVSGGGDFTSLFDANLGFNKLRLCR